MCVSDPRLLANRIATTNSTQEIATCATTTSLPGRAAIGPLPAGFARPFRTDDKSSRVAASAGTRPKSSTATNAESVVNINSWRSIAKVKSKRPTADDRKRTNEAAAAGAAIRPSAPPAAASRALSVRSWRISRDRLAPSDSRTPISRRRADARASRRFATLAVAISNNSATTVMSTTSGREKRRRSCVSPPLADMTSICSGCSSFHSAPHWRARRVMFARTFPFDTPGRVLPTARNVKAMAFFRSLRPP